MASTPSAGSVPSTTSTRVLAQDVQPSRKRTADIGNASEVPFKQPRPAEAASETFVTPYNAYHQHQFNASLATDRASFPQQESNGVRLSLDSGVHEISASSDRQNSSSHSSGFAPVNDETAASSKWTLEVARDAARLSSDSGIRDLSIAAFETSLAAFETSLSRARQNRSSNVADAQPFDDVSDKAASESKHAQGFKVLRALLVTGESSTSDVQYHSSDSKSIQPSVGSLPAFGSGQLGDAARFADFTAFTSPCPPAQKRDGPYKVYSRLQTMNNVKRYDVSVDELRRRASLPEGFNAAILNSYLRRPKAAENVRELRSELSDNGLTVANGRRHHKNLTAFSCLVEQEAKDLANDYDDLSKTFPHQPVGQKLARSLQGPNKLANIQAAIQLLEGSLIAISDAAKAEPADQSTKNAAQGAKKKCGLEDFTLRTHGFGLAAHRTAWASLLQTLKTAASTVQQQMPPRMPPMMQMPSTSGFAPPPWSMPPMSPFYPFMGCMPYGKR